jgi:hypothetical protein
MFLAAKRQKYLDIHAAARYILDQPDCRYAAIHDNEERRARKASQGGQK